MSKYYKSFGGLIVKYLDQKNEMEFNGEVVAGNQGQYSNFVTCLNSYFTPYEPTPQELIQWGETATLTNDNPNKVEVSEKDVNLRLECLKLTVASNIGLLTDMGDITKEANVAYNWIKTNQ